MGLKYVPDLVHMGAQFEANYQRLMRLLRMLGDEEHTRFFLNIGDRFVGQVSIKLIESSKYTDTLLLEQISSAGPWLNNPAMTVRLYHDASVAEVISSNGHRAIQSVNQYPNKFMHHPDEKSQLNTFLSEWLNFCLLHGCCEQSPHPGANL